MTSPSYGIKPDKIFARDEAVVDYIGFVNLHGAMNNYIHHFELSPSDFYHITNKLVKD